MKMRPQLNFIFATVCVFSIVVENSLQRSSPGSSHYTAAVVEYHPYTNGSDLEVFQKNVEAYVGLISDASTRSNNADIIVFPECGLGTFNKLVYTQVPNPDAEIVPCHDVTGVYDNLRNISCAAKEHEIYVVINLYEEFPCTNETTSDYNETCPAKVQAFYYNTNVVFDREGKVVARYRKFHLFGEDGIGTPPQADVVTFETDFGVTFGLFTCFDIMFEKPAVQLIREKNITDIIFPTAWFSELPFLTAVQAQAAWAHGMDVNFLGAGYNDPPLGSGGSGIYSGRDGPLKSVMTPTPSTHLLVSPIAKRPQSSRASQPANDVTPAAGIYLKQDNLTVYKSHLLDLAGEAKTLAMNLCDGDFCCDFEVLGKRTAGGGVSYAYRLVVFNGVRSFDGVANGGMQICALVACTSDSVASCGATFPPEAEVVPVEFQLLRMRGVFKKAGTQLANTVTESYLPLPTDNYVMLWLPLDAEDLVTAEMVLVKKASPLTFGIFGRDFTRDSEDITNMAAALSAQVVGFVTLLVLALQTIFL